MCKKELHFRSSCRSTQITMDASHIAIVLTFLVGFVLYLGKLQFVIKLLAAKSHVNVFNHSLAICLFASGEKKILATLFALLNVSGIGTMICLPASVWLLNKEGSYEEKTFQI